MTEVKHSTIAQWAIAGLLGALLAALACVAAMPATAHATSRNYGGLVFTWDDDLTSEAEANISVQTLFGVETVVVTGNVDFEVSQYQIAQGPIASCIQLGEGTIGNNYTGNLTITNTQLASGPAVKFNNRNTSQDPCTVTLGEGVTFMPPEQLQGPAPNHKSLIDMGSYVDDTLVIGDGVNLVMNPKQTDADTNQYAGINIHESGSQTVQFTGDANFNIPNDRGIQVLTNSGTTIEVAEGASPNITAGNAIAIQASAVATADVDTLTVNCEGTLNLSGVTNSSTGTGSQAFVINNYAYASNVVFNGDGIVNVYGGDGDGKLTGPANDGGAAIAFGNLAQTGSAVASTLTINGGVFNAIGGDGGASVNNSAGDGGPGIVVNSGSTGNETSIVVNNGNVNVTGGNDGSRGTTPSNDKNSGLRFVNAGQGVLKVANGTEINGSGPTVTVVGGANVTNSGTGLHSAFDNFSNISQISIQDGADKTEDFYPWVFITKGANAGDPTQVETTASLVGFNGMTAAMTPPNTSEVWAEITPAPLESLSMGVLDNAGKGVNFVQAQTNGTINGVTPDSAYVYQTTYTATFEGVDNLDTSNFGQLLTGSINTLDADIAPATNVSSDFVGTDHFYVVPDATGNFLTITPGENAEIPAELEEMYPGITSFGELKIPVVYTITMKAGNQVTVANPQWFTSADGSGVVVTDAGITAPEKTPVGNLAQGATATGSNVIIGVFDENGDAPVQVNQTQVTGYDSNETYTVEAGTLTLKSVAPTPVDLAQGDDTELTATYDVTALNTKITSYSMYVGGVDPDWDSLFVDQGTGNPESNGVTSEVTGGNTATLESGKGTVTSILTVSAATDASLGLYRFAPTVGQDAFYLNTNPPSWQSGGNTGKVLYVAVNVVAGSGAEGMGVVRLYNPYTYEHIYSTDANEVRTLEGIGWANEDIAWYQPTKSATPIYRLFNPNNGDHMYTTSLIEYTTLDNSGWNGEGQQLWSAPNDEGVDIYRLFNPWMTANEGAYAHLWTGDFNEYTSLSGKGWSREGVAWWALSVPGPQN